MADPTPDVSPCVACGYRDSIDGDFCQQCSEQKLVDDYWQEDAEALEVRRNDWKTRSHSTLAQRERQHRSRLLRATRPAERPHAFSDPLEIAMTALEACMRVRQAVRSNTVARARLDEIELALRQLAWGPEPKRSRTSP